MEEAERLEGRLTSMSDAFYHYPETAFQEHETSAALQRFLTDYGFAVERGYRRA